MVTHQVFDKMLASVGQGYVLQLCMANTEERAELFDPKLEALFRVRGGAPNQQDSCLGVTAIVVFS